MQQISPCTSFELRLLTSQKDVCHTAQHAMLFRWIQLSLSHRGRQLSLPPSPQKSLTVFRHSQARSWPRLAWQMPPPARQYNPLNPTLSIPNFTWETIWAYTALGVESGYSEPPPPSIPWRNGMKEEEPECNCKKLCPTLTNRPAGRGRLQCCLISLVLNATVDTSSGASPRRTLTMSCCSSLSRGGGGGVSQCPCRQLLQQQPRAYVLRRNTRSTAILMSSTATSNNFRILLSTPLRRRGVQHGWENVFTLDRNLAISWRIE